MAYQVIAVCMLVTVLWTSTPCLGGTNFGVERVQLYPIQQGGRVFVTGNAVKEGDTLECELTFIASQWPTATADSTALAIRGESNIAAQSWTVTVQPDANIDAAQRSIKLKGTFQAGKQGDVRFSYQMPAGGWALTYDVLLPDPAIKAPDNELYVNTKLSVRNASGLDWPPQTPFELFASPTATVVLTPDFVDSKPLLPKLPNMTTSFIPYSGKLPVKYELRIPASTQTSPLKEGDIYPTIALTYQGTKTFPKAGITAAVNFLERGQSIPASGPLSNGKTYTVGKSSSAIQLTRTDTKEAVGLVDGTLYYSDISKLTFTNSLKLDVSLKDVCESPCCSHPNATLSAAAGPPLAFNVVFKSNVPKAYIVTGIVASTTPNEIQSDIDRIKKIVDAVSAKGNCKVSELKSVICQLQKDVKALCTKPDPSIYDDIGSSSNPLKKLIEDYNKKTREPSWPPVLPCCEYTMPPNQP